MRRPFLFPPSPFFFEIARKKIFEDLFFFENTCACVRGPWPRGGLSSEGLALALDFLCPWPRALCPRLHLCF